MSEKDTGATPDPVNETKPLENNATPPAPAQTGNAGSDEAEKLRKELEKANMRANQLQNKLDETAAEKAERERKELEENQKFKELADQERARADALEEGIKERERKASIDAATEQIFADYNEDVVELAKEAGISLTEASEEAQTALKAKLDKFADRIQSKRTPSPTNPQTSQPGNSKQQAMDNYIANRGKAGEMAAFAELAKTIPSIQQNMNESRLN